MTPTRSLLLALGILLTAFTATAHAGTYDVYSCTDPATAHGLGALSGWEFRDTHPQEDNFSVVDSCAQDGGSIGVALAAGNTAATRATGSNPRTGSLYFLPASGTKIRAYELWRSMFVDTTGRTVFVSRSDDGGTGESCYAWSTLCRIGDQGIPLAGVNHVSRSFAGAPASYIQLKLSCDGGDCPTAPSAASVRLFAAKVTLEDLNRPTFTSLPSGSLLTGGQVSGTRTLDLVAADVGSGVRSVTISSDAAAGQVLASKNLDTGDGNCPAAAFKRIVPCPTSVDETVDVDTKQ